MEPDAGLQGGAGPSPEVSAAAAGRWLPGCDLVTGPHRDSLHLGAIDAGWSAPWAPGTPVGFCLFLGAGEADTPARNCLWGSGQLPLLERSPLRGSLPPAQPGPGPQDTLGLLCGLGSPQGCPGCPVSGSRHLPPS